MALPEIVRVKLSSEAAESIALTPVVVQDLTPRELIEHMLGVTGKDEARIRELLRRGTLVSGASRFRWTGWEAEAEGIRALLATFPDPDPQRAFDPTRCARAILWDQRHAVEVQRAAAERRSLFRRDCFWDVLMELAGAPGLRYATYSYRDRADRYTRGLTPQEVAHLRQAAPLLRYTRMRDQVAMLTTMSVDLFVER